MQLYVNSEFGQLKAILLASIKNFSLHQPINDTQRHYYSSDPPQLAKLLEQEERFVKVLERHGVSIFWATPLENASTQFFVRDVGAVIHDTFVVCSMKVPFRQRETSALEKLIATIESPVVRVDSGVLEGGDIILDGDTLYVGLGERTNSLGLEWLVQHFGNTFEILPLKLSAQSLHLDVVFNVLGRRRAFIYAPAFQSSSVEMLAKRYELIEVSSEEQFSLATNIISLSPDTVVTDVRHSRLNELLQQQGYDVIPLEFSEIAKIGGALRCGSCPLLRD